MHQLANPNTILGQRKIFYYIDMLKNFLPKIKRDSLNAFHSKEPSFFLMLLLKSDKNLKHIQFKYEHTFIFVDSKGWPVFFYNVKVWQYLSSSECNLRMLVNSVYSLTTISWYSVYSNSVFD